MSATIRPAQLRPGPSRTRHARLLPVITLFLFALAPTAALPQTRGGGQSEPVVLADGARVARDLGGGESHDYRIKLASGQSLHVLVEQSDVDASVILFGPSGETLARVDSPNGTQGPEPLYWVAKGAGTYGLKVAATALKAERGRYELTVRGVRRATPEDESRVGAQSAFAEGERLRRLRTTEGIRGGIEKFKEALARWREAGEGLGEAWALTQAGLSHYFLAELEAALDYYRRALPVWQAIADRNGEAIIFDRLATVSAYQGEMLRSVELFTHALRLRRAAGDRQGESVTLTGLGIAYASLGEYQKALDHLRQALPLRHAVGDRSGEAYTLHSVGNVHHLLGESEKALDFAASKERATGAELSQYRVVHFATHALLNGEHPELSGVVLSLVDEQGRARGGFLRLHEVYNLNLPAELVVLSACRTGLGKEVKGEGLVGLARGFMYAGAARVLASLWKVDDEATAELMRGFYKGMLRDGLRPAAALRAAQVEMSRQRRWQSPYYWGAFVLQGEWR